MTAKVIIDTWDRESVSAHVEKDGQIINLPEVLGHIANEEDAQFAAECEAKRINLI